MDNQLTFQDSNPAGSANQAYAYLETGELENAYRIFDALLNETPDYPGVEHGYRTARWWINRQKPLAALAPGKASADFLMTEWSDFERYAAEKGMKDSSAFKAVRTWIFFTAGEHYRTAFLNQESPTDNFSLLVNLGICFLTQKEYSRTIETLEYARSTFKAHPNLLALLGEAYCQSGELPKGLMLFREAFFINPTEIQMEHLESEPIRTLLATVREHHPDEESREWIPVYGFLMDIFYVKSRLSSQTVELIVRDIQSMERSFQSQGAPRHGTLKPRLINKYLWLYDYYKFQHYDLAVLSQISERLIAIDRSLFYEYFKQHSK